MRNYHAYLNSIHADKEVMIDELVRWVNINSGSYHLQGLERMMLALKKAFTPLNATMEELHLPPHTTVNNEGQLIDKPLGKALYITKRPNAPLQIFLGGHMDTVFPDSSSFQRAERIEKERMRGPGIIDMKGGLMILLQALKTLENCPFASKIGWRVLISSDEEIGSPSSSHLYPELSKGCQLGLLFEPALPGGSLAGARKGSFSFTIIAKGKSAHAGRHHHMGENAITALCRLIIQIEGLNDRDHGITVNVGKIAGGGPLNIVPDLAICGVNVRMIHPGDLPKIKDRLRALLKEHNRKDNLSLDLLEMGDRPPKPFDSRQETLFSKMKECGEELDIEITWKPTGGVADGNLLYAAGVPNIDSLGATGEGMHTHDETIDLNSLVERSQLASLFLIKIADEGFHV